MTVLGPHKVMDAACEAKATMAGSTALAVQAGHAVGTRNLQRLCQYEIALLSVMLYRVR